MKAIARDTYGAPDVFELRDVEKPTVAPDGVLVRVRAASLNPCDWHMLRGLVMSRFVSQELLPFLAKITKADLVVLSDLVEAGKLRPVIDRTFPLSEAAGAIRYLEEGHARGNVVVTV